MSSEFPWFIFQQVHPGCWLGTDHRDPGKRQVESSSSWREKMLAQTQVELVSSGQIHAGLILKQELKGSPDGMGGEG